MLRGNRERFWCMGIGAALVLPIPLALLAGWVNERRYGRASG
jgi:hypothetical protein